MEKKKNFIVNTMFWGLIAVLVLLFIKYLFPIFVPFVIAFIIAAIIQMLAKRICKNSEKYRKPVSVTLCIVFYIGIAFLVVGIGSKLVQVVAGFIVAAPDIYKNDIAPMINELADILGKRFSSYDTGISQQLENTMLDVSQNMGQYISDFSMKAVKWFSGGITGIPGGIVKVEEMWNDKESYHYSQIGAFLCLLHIPFKMRNHYFCSEFVVELLQQCKSISLKKHCSRYLPNQLPAALTNQKCLKEIIYDPI